MSFYKFLKITRLLVQGVYCISVYYHYCFTDRSHLTIDFLNPSKVLNTYIMQVFRGCFHQTLIPPLRLCLKFWQTRIYNTIRWLKFCSSPKWLPHPSLTNTGICQCRPVNWKNSESEFFWRLFKTIYKIHNILIEAFYTCHSHLNAHRFE